ncbi:hypothetical protein [Staphylococcus phage vB_ScaM-V1SC04]|nr:hypothetical protein [Staphylococcus phage vB_ScaM-V1SC04]
MTKEMVQALVLHLFLLIIIKKEINNSTLMNRGEIDLTNKLFYDTISNEEINKSVLNLLLGEELSLDYVSKNSDDLDVKYEHVYKSLGFDNFFDCFLYANREPEIVHKGGNKNLGGLNKVKRTVIRNGKEMQMTVYEDGNKDNDSKEKQEGKEEVSRSAVGARAISNGEEGKVNPKKVANSLSSLSKKGVDVSHVSTNSSLYKEFVDDNGDTLGITSFKRTENDIILESYASSPDSDGVGARAIMELLRLSIKENKNAVVYNIELPEAIEYLKTLGFKPNKDGYILRKKDVKQFLGDYSDFI